MSGARHARSADLPPDEARQRDLRIVRRQPFWEYRLVS